MMPLNMYTKRKGKMKKSKLAIQLKELERFIYDNFDSHADMISGLANSLGYESDYAHKRYSYKKKEEECKK